MSRLCPLFACFKQAIAQSALLLGRRIELRNVRKGIEAAEPEELLEELRGAVEHRAELRAPRFMDESSLEQRADGRLGRHAADAGDLGPRDGLEVGDDRETLGLGLRERRGARPGQEAPFAPITIQGRTP